METDKLNIAHYFFATRALLQATKGRGEDFIREWIGKIRETPWNRTNATTVLTAFQQISKEDLSRFLK